MSFSPKRRELFSKIEPWLYLSPFLIFIIIFTLYPVINVFTISFKENYSYLRGTFKALNFENYKYCIPRSKKDIGALKKGQSALKRGQLKKCQI